jgi:hypothetical protein
VIAHASSQRLAEKSRWMARSSRSDSERRYASIIFPIDVVRSERGFVLSVHVGSRGHTGEFKQDYFWWCGSLCILRVLQAVEEERGLGTFSGFV